jgi:hypothetical protein
MMMMHRCGRKKSLELCNPNTLRIKSQYMALICSVLRSTWLFRLEPLHGISISVFDSMSKLHKCVCTAGVRMCLPCLGQGLFAEEKPLTSVAKTAYRRLKTGRK